jgi:hypothetical protein
MSCWISRRIFRSWEKINSFRWNQINTDHLRKMNAELIEKWVSGTVHSENLSQKSFVLVDGIAYCRSMHQERRYSVLTVQHTLAHVLQLASIYRRIPTGWHCKKSRSPNWALIAPVGTSEIVRCRRNNSFTAPAIRRLSYEAINSFGVSRRPCENRILRRNSARRGRCADR